MIEKKILLIKSSMKTILNNSIAIAYSYFTDYFVIKDDASFQTSYMLLLHC